MTALLNPFASMIDAAAIATGADRKAVRAAFATAYAPGQTPAARIRNELALAAALAATRPPEVEGEGESRRRDAAPEDHRDRRVVCPGPCGGKGWVGPDEERSEFCPVCRGYRTVQARAASCICQGVGWRAGADGVAVPCPDCVRGSDTIPRRLIAAGVPVEYLSFTMADFDRLAGDQEGVQFARDAVATIIRYPEGWVAQSGRPGLFLTSREYGTGKTGLAVVLAKALIEQGLTVAFVVFDRFLDDLKATFAGSDPRRPGDVFGRLLRAQVLIVDDMGTGKRDNDWRTEQAYHLFDSRLSGIGAKGLTIVTSNLDLDGIRDAYDGRVASRLDRLCFVADVDGRDLRRRDGWK